MKFAYVTAVPAVPERSTIYFVRDVATEQLQITIVDATGKRTDIKDKVLGQNGSEMSFWGGGGDINTLRDPGVYSVTIPQSGLVPNWPFPGKGVLRVETSDFYSIQYAIELSSLTMMVRAHSSQSFLPMGTWSEWRVSTRFSGPLEVENGGTGVDSVAALKRKMGITFGNVSGGYATNCIASALTTYKASGVYTPTNPVAPSSGYVRGPFFQGAPFVLSAVNGKYLIQSVDPETSELYYLTGTYDVNTFAPTAPKITQVVTENMPSRNITGVGTTLSTSIDVNNNKWKTLVPSTINLADGFSEFFLVTPNLKAAFIFRVAAYSGYYTVSGERIFGDNLVSENLPVLLRWVAEATTNTRRLEILWPSGSTEAQPTPVEITRRYNYKNGIALPTLAENVNTVLPENMMDKNCISLRNSAGYIFETFTWHFGDLTYILDGSIVNTVTKDTSV